MKRSTSKARSKRSGGSQRTLTLRKKDYELRPEMNIDLFAKVTAFMKENGLAEFNMKSKDLELHLRFADAQAPVAAASRPSAAPAEPVPARAPEAPASTPAPARSGKPTITINSPFVGTFYRSPGPNQDSFVEVGQTVTPGQTLCIVEAMKLMNEIESDAKGRITKILVENGTPVEFGEALFELEAH